MHARSLIIVGTVVHPELFYEERTVLVPSCIHPPDASDGLPFCPYCGTKRAQSALRRWFIPDERTDPLPWEPRTDLKGIMPDTVRGWFKRASERQSEIWGMTLVPHSESRVHGPGSPSDTFILGIIISRTSQMIGSHGTNEMKMSDLSMNFRRVKEELGMHIRGYFEVNVFHLLYAYPTETVTSPPKGPERPW